MVSGAITYPGEKSIKRVQDCGYEGGDLDEMQLEGPVGQYLKDTERRHEWERQRHPDSYGRAFLFTF